MEKMFLFLHPKKKKNKNFHYKEPPYPNFCCVSEIEKENDKAVGGKILIPYVYV